MASSYRSAVERERPQISCVRNDRIGTEQVLSGSWNVFAPSAGENLPAGWSRSYGGLLLRDSVTVPASDLDTGHIQTEIAHLRAHVVIACFLEGNLTPSMRSVWLEDLALIVSPHRVLLHKDIGRGFTYVKVDNPAATRKLVQGAIHHFRAGNAVYQHWVDSFDPNRPIGVFTPVWLSLRLVPLELFTSAYVLTARLGHILVHEPPKNPNGDHRFCIGMELGKGWVSKLRVERAQGVTVDVPIDYENFQINCRCCGSSAHHVSHCPERPPRFSPQ